MNESKLKVLIAVDDTDESMDAVSAAYDLFGAAPDYMVTSIGRMPTMSCGRSGAMARAVVGNFFRQDHVVRECLG